MRAGADPRADVDVARHQDHAGAEEAASTGRRAGHHAHAASLVVALQLQLVEIFEGTNLGPLQPAQAKEQ